MGRPRAFDAGTVVEAARDLFWERGYEGASVGELEERTGVNRSSLYSAFGSKHELFDAALHSYLDQVTRPMLAGMQRPDSGVEEVAEFFLARAESFRYDPGGGRGCLLINAIAEFGPHDPRVARAAVTHRQWLHHAFATALGQAAEQDGVDACSLVSRADLLVMSTMGVFLTARTDPEAAADHCRAIATEVSSWRRA